jgi:Fe-S-cluster containining protein
MIKDPCHNCGCCCLQMRRPPFMPKYGRTVAITRTDGSVDEICIDVEDDLPEAVLADYQEKLVRLLSDSDARGVDKPCFWLDLETLRCTHYDHRPEVCREFKVGGKHCNGWRETYDLMPIYPTGETVTDEDEDG